jgi:hypothetical protein
MRVSLPESWQNGEAFRLPSIEVTFIVGGLLLTWKINDNSVMSSADDDTQRMVAVLAQVSAEGRAFSTWREAVKYMQAKYPDYATRFFEAVEPLLHDELPATGGAPGGVPSPSVQVAGDMAP